MRQTTGQVGAVSRPRDGGLGGGGRGETEEKREGEGGGREGQHWRKAFRFRFLKWYGVHYYTKYWRRWCCGTIAFK